MCMFLSLICIASLLQEHTLHADTVLNQNTLGCTIFISISMSVSSLSLWHVKSLAVTKLTHVPWRPLTKAHCFNRLNAHRALSVRGEVKRWGYQKRTSSCTSLLISINLPPAPLNLGTLCPSLPPLPSSCQASLLQTDSISVAMRGCVSSLQTPATLPHWSPECLSCRWTVDQVHFDQKKGRQSRSVFQIEGYGIVGVRGFRLKTSSCVMFEA